MQDFELLRVEIDVPCEDIADEALDRGQGSGGRHSFAACGTSPRYLDRGQGSGG